LAEKNEESLLRDYVMVSLAAYQLGHIPDAWDPFFAGSPLDPQNGTEEIITSAVSKAWPVSDAAVGGYTYLLEILTGIIGSRMRWRTTPWLVVLFAAAGHRHLEHHSADRRGGDTHPNLLFTRRTARDSAVPAPSREGRTELAARALRR
jgi:hypothetical protein